MKVENQHSNNSELNHRSGYWDTGQVTKPLSILGYSRLPVKGEKPLSIQYCKSAKHNSVLHNF